MLEGLYVFATWSKERHLDKTQVEYTIIQTEGVFIRGNTLIPDAFSIVEYLYEWIFKYIVYINLWNPELLAEFISYGYDLNLFSWNIIEGSKGIRNIIRFILVNI